MRPAASDLMQTFRFHVTASKADGKDPLDFTERGENFGEGGGHAGFQSVTMPDITVEATEYREGTMQWTQKYPGPPTVSEGTLMRGVAKKDTTFHDWVMDSILGKEYRVDLNIWHYHRTEMSKATSSSTDDAIRHIACYNCFCIRAKPGGDFDSMSGEVSLMECDFSTEYFEVIKGS